MRMITRRGVKAESELTEADRCTAEVLDQIRRRKIKPDERLGELPLARRLRVGRAAVRLAFDRLAQVGILERIPNAGTFVKKVTLEDYCQLMDTRAVLEGLSARLACDRATAADLEELNRLAAQADQAVTRYVDEPDFSQEQVKEYEVNFHLALARVGGNARVQRILFEQHLFEDAYAASQTMPRLKGQRYHAPGHPPSHADIVAAIAQRDHDRAEQLLKSHILVTKEEQVALHMGMSAPATR